MPENGGSATATVTRFVADNSLPLVVDLATNDGTEATVPATVTILANQNSATFTVTAVDDAIRDVTQNPTITASAAGMGNGAASIAVTDDEIDSITLAIVPGTISENGGTATGTLTRFVGSNSTALVVSLGSSDTSEASVPASVTIPAGQNSVTFTVSGVNDTLRDFNQSVIVTASAAGVASTTASVTVTDDELDPLTFSLADNFMMENGGTISVTVTRTVADNSLPQIVDLSSDDTTEATVPATVTIPGGQNSANFTITAVDDVVAIGDGPRTVTVGGSASGFAPANARIIVGDDERPFQNQRNILDVDANLGVFALDSLKIINIINEIGVGDAANIMALYSGPQIFPDTNGDNFITAGDVLGILNFLNASLPLTGGEGEAEDFRSSAPMATPRTVSSHATAAAVLAIVEEDAQPFVADDAPRGKRGRAQWDELVGDLALDLVRRRRD